MTAPMPSLKYNLEPRDEYLDGEVPIHRACEVSVSMWREGLSVTVSGPLRRMDGEPGRHWRGSRADLTAPQPAWLQEIIADARVRLS